MSRTAAGMRIADVGVELPPALALYSARSDTPLPSGTSVAGEVNLAGEVRPAPQMAHRARTGKEMGMARCIGPGEDSGWGDGRSGEMDRVSSIENALGCCLGERGDSARLTLITHRVIIFHDTILQVFRHGGSGERTAGQALFEHRSGSTPQASSVADCGQHSIRVNNRFRVCFRWSATGAEDVEIVDYH